MGFAAFTLFLQTPLNHVDMPMIKITNLKLRRTLAYHSSSIFQVLWICYKEWCICSTFWIFFAVILILNNIMNNIMWTCLLLILACFQAWLQDKSQTPALCLIGMLDISGIALAKLLQQTLLSYESFPQCVYVLIYLARGGIKN